MTAWASERLLAAGTVLVDPDAIARDRNLSPVAGGRAALALIDASLCEGRELLVETTLSGRNAFGYIRDARQLGYDIRLLYIGTENVNINLRRIEARVARGGHDVPPEDVRRRWARSFTNLPPAMKAADRTGLFDNSRDVGPIPVAEIRDQSVVALAPFPAWAEDAIRAYEALP